MCFDSLVPVINHQQRNTESFTQFLKTTLNEIQKPVPSKKPPKLSSRLLKIPSSSTQKQTQTTTRQHGIDDKFFIKN